MRGKTIRVVGYLLVLLLISSTALASEQWLEYRSFANPQMMMNDVGARSLTLTTTPPDGVALPELLCETPYFAVWETPMTESGKIHLAFASKQKKGTYGLLYIDTNGDGSLQDEEPVKAGMVNSFQSEFAPVEVLLKGEDGPVSYHLRLLLLSRSNAKRLYAYSAGWYEGDIELGGKTLRCMLVDHNINGTFNDRLTEKDRGDQVRVGKGSRPPIYLLGKHLWIEGTYYNVEPARDGAFIALTVATDVVEGTVRVPDEVTLLSVLGDGGSFHLSPEAGLCKLPDGIYRIEKWEMERKDDAGVLWKAVATGSAQSFEVKPGVEQALKVGEPLMATMTVSAESKKLTFAQQLKGQLGESISLTRNGKRSAAPKLRMRNKSGTLDRAHQFQYG